MSESFVYVDNSDVEQSTSTLVADNAENRSHSNLLSCVKSIVGMLLIL